VVHALPWIEKMEGGFTPEWYRILIGCIGWLDGIVFVDGVLVEVPRGLPVFPGAEAVRMCRRASVDRFGRYDTIPVRVPGENILS